MFKVYKIRLMLLVFILIVALYIIISFIIFDRIPYIEKYGMKCEECNCKKKLHIKKDINTIIFVLSPFYVKYREEAYNATIKSLENVGYDKSNIYIYTSYKNCKNCIYNYKNEDYIQKLGNTYNDNNNRVKWRSNIVLNYARMLNYVYKNFNCSILITTEDDVVHHYKIGDVPLPFSPYNGKNKHICKSYEKKYEQYTGYGALSFCFPCEYLQQLYYFLLGNFNVKPLDWLIVDFFKFINVPFKMTKTCSMVQHIGDKKSTRKTPTNRLKRGLSEK